MARERHPPSVLAGVMAHPAEYVPVEWHRRSVADPRTQTRTVAGDGWQTRLPLFPALPMPPAKAYRHPDNAHTRASDRPPRRLPVMTAAPVAATADTPAAADWPSVRARSLPVAHPASADRQRRCRRPTTRPPWGVDKPAQCPKPPPPDRHAGHRHHQRRPGRNPVHHSRVVPRFFWRHGPCYRRQWPENPAPVIQRSALARSGDSPQVPAVETVAEQYPHSEVNPDPARTDWENTAAGFCPAIHCSQ